MEKNKIKILVIKDKLNVMEKEQIKNCVIRKDYNPEISETLILVIIE